MAFLDNSGDIILDAVLTDVGRQRLAKGNGSFKISEFALGDDEINYALYNAGHASGSAYFDLQILQTPVLEAFTNNGSSMKSKLITVTNTNLLYLPVLQLNELWGGGITSKNSEANSYVVCANEDTEILFEASHKVMYGENKYDTPNYIRVDQGLDTTAISPAQALPADLTETQYALKIDNRLGDIWAAGSTERLAVSTIDDDNIATYYVSLGANPSFVVENSVTSATATNEVISGPRGTILEFKIGASLVLTDSSALFDEIGGRTFSITGKSGANTVNYIDSTVRVEGLTTGYSMDIPVRFIRS